MISQKMKSKDNSQPNQSNKNGTNSEVLAAHDEKCEAEFISQLKGLKSSSSTIATISFASWREKNSKKDDTNGAIYNNAALIREAINIQKPDILLCAGYSITFASLEEIKNTTKDKKTIILLETIDEDNVNGMNYLVRGGEAEPMGRICFAKAADAKIAKEADKLGKIIKNRKFEINNPSKRKALLLVCGEINSVRNRDGLYNNFNLLESYIKECSIIFNPTHTRMSEMHYKREFLSGNNIYISSSNFITKSCGKVEVRPQLPEAATTHTLWRNGKEYEHLNQVCVPEHVLYREWDLSFPASLLKLKPM